MGVAGYLPECIGGTSGFGMYPRVSQSIYPTKQHPWKVGYVDTRVPESIYPSERVCTWVPESVYPTELNTPLEGFLVPVAAVACFRCFIFVVIFVVQFLLCPFRDC